MDGNNLRILLEQSGISISKISELTNITRSKFYRVFENATELTYREVLLLCEVLGLTELEFRAYVGIDSIKNFYVAKYKFFEKNKGRAKKEELDEIMNYFSKYKFCNLNSFLLYMRCKMFLYTQVKAYEGLEQEDLAYLHDYLKDNKHNGSTIFFILAALVPEFPYTFLKKFYIENLPIKNDYLFVLSLEERTAIREFTSNLFDKAFEAKDFNFANKLNNDLETFVLYYPSLKYDLLIKCRKNYLLLMNKFDRELVKEIEIYIDALDKIGDKPFSVGIAQELNDIFRGNDYKIPKNKMLSE